MLTCQVHNWLPICSVGVGVFQCMEQP